MKILYIVNVAAPYRVDFFNELGKNVDLTVFFERSQVANREENWYKNDFKNFKSIVNTSNSSIKGFYILIKLIVENQYDEIILGGYSTKIGIKLTLLFKLLRKKYILNIDGGIIKPEKNITKIGKKILISSADRWLCPGKHSLTYLKHYGAIENKIYLYPFTSLKKSDVLDTTVSAVKKSEIRKKLNIKENVIILYVGRFIKSKGIDTLLKSIKNYDDVGLYIIGGEPAKEYLNIIKDRGLKNVYFLNFKSKEELDEYYCSSDMFVLPTRSDVWGLVINEAMAKGLPIITTSACNAGIELVEDYKNGFIVQPDNIEQLSLKIDFLVTNTTSRKQMGINNLMKINDYTIEKMSEASLECFKRK